MQTRPSSAAEAGRRFTQLVVDHRLPVDRWPIVQALATGDAYGVCLLYNRGELRASFCERYLRCKDGVFGTSVFRESVMAPDLVELATTMVRPLGWHGLVHFDFLRDERTRRTALIEANPRFWGALDLAVRAGVDFPWLLYQMAVEGDVDPVTTYRPGVRSRWIVGELLHLFNHARRAGLRDARRRLAAVARDRADGFDDFRLADPLPLLGEMLYYGTQFALTRSTNPVEEGMIA